MSDSKYEDWDKIINDNKDNNDKSMSEPYGPEIYITKQVYANTNGTNTQNSKIWRVIGTIGTIVLLVIFIDVIIPLFSGGGGSGTYRLKNASFEQNSTINYEYYAIIENTSNQSHSYIVTLEIYTPSGSLYNSISDNYSLQAGGTDTVLFFVNVPVGYYGSYKVKVTVT